MRIIDPFYMATTLTIMVGISVLLYDKFYRQPTEIFHIVISGSKIQSFLFAYELSKIGLTNLNVTLIGKFDPQIIKFLDSGDLQYDNIHMPSLNSPYIDRKILQFCGDQPFLKQLLVDTHLQYKVKRASTLFNKGSNTISSQEHFSADTYRIDNEGVSPGTIYKYGLSHQTAKWIFNSFQKHLLNLPFTTLRQQSMKGVMNQIMPSYHKPAPNGISYLSETIGLDQKYIRDFVNPVISSTYFHNVNSVAILFKLLPLYCQNNDVSWTKKSSSEKNYGKKNNALIFDERLLAAKILQNLRDSSSLLQISLVDRKVLQFQQVSNHKVVLKIGDTLTFKKNTETYPLDADTLFILQDLEEENEKQVSYYKTIVDGLIHNDQQQEQVYTIYFQNQMVLSVTRLCAEDCKQFRNSVYLVISKTKLYEKDLIMFTEHQIITSKKQWNPRPHLQSSTIKFQQTPHIYRIVDTELISDSYEMKLLIFKNLANSVRAHATSYKHYEARRHAKPEDPDIDKVQQQEQYQTST